METVSTGGWIPALMIDGFSVEQLVVLASSMLFCLKMHWEKYGTRSYAFYVSYVALFGMKENATWHMTHLYKYLFFRYLM